MNINENKERETFIDKVGGKANAIAMFVFLIIALSSGILWIEAEARKADAGCYITSWEITENRNIEWSWAGKGM